MAITRLAIVGGSWRADFYHRIARALPETFSMVGATTRSEAGRQKIASRWEVPVFPDSPSMVKATQPDFVVNCGGWDTILDVMRPLHAVGATVLCETPPGWHREQQEEMNAMVRDGLKMQVAEQGWLQPEHQALLGLCQSGKLGEITYMNSTGGGYHGMALVRKFLGLQFEIPTIRAIQKRQPILEGPGREGYPNEERMTETILQVVTLEFPTGQLAVMTSSGQHFHPIRRGHLHLYGTRGIVQDKQITVMADHQTPLTYPLTRHEAGVLEPKALHAIQIGDHYYWQNRWPHISFSDDEIAVAEAMWRMVRYCQTGEAFYSFADAAWDQTICLLIKKASQEATTLTPDAPTWS